MKLCKDCIHHTFDTTDRCRRKPPLTNNVTGEKFYATCASERKRSPRDMFLTMFSRCGEKGGFFEPRSGGVEFRWETPGDYFDA